MAASSGPPTVRFGKPALALDGVDSSGAREVDGRNGKVWIASCHPRNGVVLECGAERRVSAGPVLNPR